MVNIWNLMNALNPVNILSAFLPPELAGTLVFAWSIIGLIAVFLLFGIIRNAGSFAYYLMHCKSRNKRMGLIPLGGKTIPVILPDKERSFNYGDDMEWILPSDSEAYDTWENGVRYTMLFPEWGTAVSPKQIMHALKSKEPYNEMYTSADVAADTYTIAAMEAEDVMGDEERSLKWIPYIIVLVIVMIGGYMIVKNMPPSEINVVVDTLATTTTMLPPPQSVIR